MLGIADPSHRGLQVAPGPVRKALCSRRCQCLAQG